MGLYLMSGGHQMGSLVLVKMEKWVFGVTRKSVRIKWNSDLSTSWRVLCILRI
jgi:hypothetical protein